MIIWITGISGAGKTTLAKELIKKIKEKCNNVIGIDGDIIRELFGNDLGYDLESRVSQIKRIQKLALFLDKQEMIVVVSALYSREDLLNWNRIHFKNYFEIYLDASLKLVTQRDVKGIYKQYQNGKEKNVVGLDIPWQPPLKHDLTINMDELPSTREIIDRIFKKINLKISIDNL